MSVMLKIIIVAAFVAVLSRGGETASVWQRVVDAVTSVGPSRVETEKADELSNWNKYYEFNDAVEPTWQDIEENLPIDIDFDDFNNIEDDLEVLESDLEDIEGALLGYDDAEEDHDEYIDDGNYEGEVYDDEDEEDLDVDELYDDDILEESPEEYYEDDEGDEYEDDDVEYDGKYQHSDEELYDSDEELYDSEEDEYDSDEYDSDEYDSDEYDSDEYEGDEYDGDEYDSDDLDSAEIDSDENYTKRRQYPSGGDGHGRRPYMQPPYVRPRLSHMRQWAHHLRSHGHNPRSVLAAGWRSHRRARNYEGRPERIPSEQRLSVPWSRSGHGSRILPHRMREFIRTRRMQRPTMEHYARRQRLAQMQGREPALRVPRETPREDVYGTRGGMPDVEVRIPYGDDGIIVDLDKSHPDVRLAGRTESRGHEKREHDEMAESSKREQHHGRQHDPERKHHDRDEHPEQPHHDTEEHPERPKHGRERPDRPIHRGLEDHPERPDQQHTDRPEHHDREHPKRPEHHGREDHPDHHDKPHHGRPEHPDEEQPKRPEHHGRVDHPERPDNPDRQRPDRPELHDRKHPKRPEHHGRETHHERPEHRDGTRERPDQSEDYSEPMRRGPPSRGPPSRRIPDNEKQPERRGPYRERPPMRGGRPYYGKPTRGYGQHSPMKRPQRQPFIGKRADFEATQRKRVALAHSQAKRVCHKLQGNTHLARFLSILDNKETRRPDANPTRTYRIEHLAKISHCCKQGNEMLECFNELRHESYADACEKDMPLKPWKRRAPKGQATVKELCCRKPVEFRHACFMEQSLSAKKLSARGWYKQRSNGKMGKFAPAGDLETDLERMKLERFGKSEEESGSEESRETKRPAVRRPPGGGQGHRGRGRLGGHGRKPGHHGDKKHHPGKHHAGGRKPWVSSRREVKHECCAAGREFGQSFNVSGGDRHRICRNVSRDVNTTSHHMLCKVWFKRCCVHPGHRNESAAHEHEEIDREIDDFEGEGYDEDFEDNEEYAEEYFDEDDAEWLDDDDVIDNEDFWEEPNVDIYDP